MTQVLDRGDWIQTATGKQFWPIAPEPKDVDIEDIAHALSMLCRFGGHCTRFYSVAEHSVLLASRASPENKLWALLHDASEAYLVDVPRPLKPFLTGYREAEDKIMRAVCDRYGLPHAMPAEVKHLDTAILSDECNQNMAVPPVAWSTATTPLGVRLRYWTPEQARDAFIGAFASLHS